MSSLPPPSRNWLLFGSATEPAPQIRLRAGPLQLLYEPTSGFVRRVRLGEQEVLRGIYAAVRDRNWGTVPGRLRETRREMAADSFQVEFESEHRQGDIHIAWRGVICGESDGSLRYEFDGEAKSTFLRNRIGFCVLHPIRECAGVAARQQRVDGSVVECRFPDTIEPQIFGQSSFRDLRAVSHKIAPRLWAEVQFDGDVFEMEDQRNWTDASFKTYCTPLALPFPVEIPAGTRIRQSVTLRLRGDVSSIIGTHVEITDPQPEAVTLTVSEEPGARLPRIGLGMASHGETLTETEIARLRLLRLAHLRADVRLSAPDWPAVWERAVREAGQLGVGLELALHLPRDRDENPTELKRRLQTGGGPLVRVLAIREGEATTTPETWRWVRQALAGVDVPVGAGSDANFCELNREQALGHLALPEADFVFWSINPQVHAFDALSIMETLEAQADTVRTAQTFADGKPLVVSPVTLKPRFNPVATAAPATQASDQLPPPVDPRQLSLFAAAWTLGSFAALAGAGIGSVTLYETTGWRGVMEIEAGSRLPEKFPSLPGAVFPIFHVLGSVAGFNQAAAIPVIASQTVAALELFRGKQRRVLLVNLTSRCVLVRVRLNRGTVGQRVLDASSAALALQAPERFLAQPGEALAGAGVSTLALEAFAFACLDLA